MRYKGDESMCNLVLMSEAYHAVESMIFDDFLDQLRAFSPPFGQSPSGLPITQDFCLEKGTSNL